MSFDKSINVLVVDDYKTMLRIMKNLLKQIGFINVYEASSGQEAYELIQKNAYDLIVSDLYMDQMSGLDLLKAVRAADADYKNTPFIMVTAESKTKNVVLAKQEGVNSYIVKPFNAETLKSKIQAVFAEIE